MCAIRSRSCGSVADQGILNLGRQWLIERLTMHTGSLFNLGPRSLDGWPRRIQVTQPWHFSNGTPDVCCIQPAIPRWLKTIAVRP